MACRNRIRGCYFIVHIAHQIRLHLSFKDLMAVIQSLKEGVQELFTLGTSFHLRKSLNQLKKQDLPKLKRRDPSVLAAIQFTDIDLKPVRHNLQEINRWYQLWDRSPHNDLGGC